MWKLGTFSLHYISLLFSPSLFAEIITRLSPVGDSRRQGYTKTLTTSLLRLYTMSTPSSGSAGATVLMARDLMFMGISGVCSRFSSNKLLAVLSRQLGQLTSCFTDSDRQRAEEATHHVTAMQAAYKAKEERRKGQEIQEWNARMSSLHAVRIALEGKSGTTIAAGRLSTAEEKKQEQREGAGYFQRTEPSGGPGFRRELTRKGLLDRIGQRRNVHRAEGPFDGRESGVPVGFGSVEDQNHPDDDPMGESDFGVLKGVKWQIIFINGQTTSWRRFEMGVLMAM